MAYCSRDMQKEARHLQKQMTTLKNHSCREPNTLFVCIQHHELRTPSFFAYPPSPPPPPPPPINTSTSISAHTQHVLPYPAQHVFPYPFPSPLYLGSFKLYFKRVPATKISKVSRGSFRSSAQVQLVGISPNARYYYRCLQPKYIIHYFATVYDVMPLIFTILRQGELQSRKFIKQLQTADTIAHGIMQAAVKCV